ncbi:hypothetical protein [Bdellovibrio sp.]|uniref:hypothetical protein n=1 Tax=Bdellovibrio sp. TaxID=28201 RepID=UPI0039E2474F
MRIKRIASFLSLLSMGLLAGHSVAMYFFIAPGMMGLSAKAFVEVNTIAEPLFEKSVPLLFLVVFVSLVTWMAAIYKNWKSAEFIHLSFALLCFVDQLYVTYQASMPLNIIMTSWKKTHDLPPQWFTLREEWASIMSYHLALSLTAFVLLILAHHQQKTKPLSPA